VEAQQVAEPQEVQQVGEPQEAQVHSLQRELPPEFQVLKFLALMFLALVFQEFQAQVEARSPTV